MADSSVSPGGLQNPGDSVGAVASLYMGHILYAIERCALSLEEEQRPLDAAFYRGIGRKLAESYGRTTALPAPERNQR